MTRDEYTAFQESLPVTNEQDDCAMVDVTYQCGAGCRNCYAPKGEHRPLLDVITEIEQTPQSRILLTGGEPLEYPDLDDVIEICRVLGKRPVLLTNGGLLTKDRLSKLIFHGLEVVNGWPQVSVSLQYPDYCNTHKQAYSNLHEIFVDTISFTVESDADVKAAKYFVTNLKGRFRTVCLRTAWRKEGIAYHAFDAVRALQGELLALPTPYGANSASVEHNGIHYKVISWPDKQNYDPAIYEGKGVWYKGANIVSTLQSL